MSNTKASYEQKHTIISSSYGIIKNDSGGIAYGKKGNQAEALLSF